MLKNKVVFITGGTKGIGYGIAASCLAEGMRVTITGRDKASAEAAAVKLGSSENVLGLESDVRNFDSQNAAVQATIDKWGQIDVVVANAGIGHFASIDDISPAQWSETIDVNLTGVFYTTKATIEALKKSKGYLITIASLAGTNFFAKGSAYNASKFGLVGFTQAVMMDVRQHGIKVTTIMPGSVSTYFNNRTPSEAESWKIQPEDIGKLTVDLLTMPARSLPSKVEMRPSMPPIKK